MESDAAGPPDWMAGQTERLLTGSMVLFGTFFVCLGTVVVPNAGMFFKKHARLHRVMGLAHLCCLLAGFFLFPFGSHSLAYHLVLGACGTGATLSAAFDFRFHDKIKNKASGTLQKETIVTFGEMLEHSFYQMLNVVQIATLHAHAWLDKGNSFSGWSVPATRAALVLIATAPWLLRSRFPVNSFMSNYKDLHMKDYTIEQVLYRIKKWQYVFYKHALLHGLNISVATRLSADTSVSLVEAPLFQIYWLALNTSYVMEFFTQTLVRKRYLGQSNMLLLQRLLMGVSSVSALFVLSYVRIGVVIVSHFLNVSHRGHDFVNVGLLLAGTLTYDLLQAESIK